MNLRYLSRALLQAGGARYLIVSIVLCTTALPAVATLQLERSIIHFQPGGPTRIDLQVTNPDDETRFVEVEVLEVRNPGTAQETRTPVVDPRRVDFLVTPNRFILAPGSRKLIRFVNTGGHSDEERIFRVNVRPVSPPMKATQHAIRLVVAYQVLAVIAPEQPAAELIIDRDARSLTVENHGNANVLFRGGIQCETEADLPERPEGRCRTLEARRVYPGNVWQLELPFDAPVEFTLSEGGRLRRERF